MPGPLSAQTKSRESRPQMFPALDRDHRATMRPMDNIPTEPHSNTEDTQPYVRYVAVGSIHSQRFSLTHYSVTDPDVVRVFVGPEKRLYLWHRKLLCAESPTIARHLERRRAWEVSVGIMPTVPTAKISDRAEAVDVVTKWLYDHEVAFSMEGGLIFDTYMCAVKLDLERLQNRVMDELQQLDMRPKGAAFDDLVKLLIHFDTGNSTTRMRNFLFDLSVSSLRESRKPFSTLSDGTLVELLKHQTL